MSFFNSARASAAAEMALVTPFLLTLMLGSFELGKYFLDQHAVTQAVRDAARYAARRNFTDFSLSGSACAVSADVVDKTRNVARTNQVASGGTARLSYWTDGPGTIEVDCSFDTSGTYQGIYRGNANGVPVVTVTAVVPYGSIIGSVGFDVVDLDLRAASEAAVAGI